MALAIETLRELHHILSLLAETQTRLERGPRQVKARETALAQLHEALEESQRQMREARMSADRKQLDLKSSDARIADWKVKLNACGSNKEYQALTDQIAAAEMAASVLADEILEMLERVDELGGRVRESEANVAAGKQELIKTTAEVDSAAQGLREEMTRLQARLVETEKLLPGEFKAEYARVVRNRGAEGLAEVDDSVCTGCGQQITVNQRNNLTMERPVFCGGCGCMLYLAP